jgi:putative ABC transport system permease protein
MISNYFKIAWRNLLKNKVYSAINVIGLATGMAVALLIGLWIWDELSYNTWHKNYNTLGQVVVQQTFDGITGAGTSMAMPTAEALRTQYPDFKEVVLTSQNDSHILAVGENKISETGMWVQPAFPTMLSLHMLAGDRAALKDPNSIILNQSVAKAFFGNADPINQILKLDNRTDLKVAGVFEDLPYNTTLRKTKFFLSWDKMLDTYNWLKQTSTDWNDHWAQIYVQLNEHTDFDKVDYKIRDLAKPHVKGYERTHETLMLFPMSKWQLYSNLESDGNNAGRIRFVWLFGIIGVFVLLLACINFMNLSTARSEKRAKEVGIRKAVGSVRGQLISQFFTESLLVAFMAMVLALLLAQLVLPFFNMLANKQVLLPFSYPLFWLIMIGFTLFTGIISGSYPAFYLSGFEPLKVLKGTFRVGRFATLPRKVLVVVQFTVSITLIIGTLIVYQQIQFAQSRPVGYSRQGLITIEMNTPDLYGHYDAIRNALIATGTVEDMGESNSATTKIYSANTGFEWKGKDPTTDPLFGTIAVSHDFGKTISWEVIAGRDFSRNFRTDSGALILNESAVKMTGMKDPVGQTMKWLGRERQIVGVVKDMVMESPYKSAFPTIFHMEYGWANLITIRMKSTVPASKALAAIGGVFKQYNPGSPFEYKFIDQQYAEKFDDEQRIGNLATFFAGFAIFISCLGLFGLAAFVAEQRTKEIGIRKVLGASIINLWTMQSKDFITLVGISCLIATPLAWYILHQWIQQYEYRADISWWIFIVAATGAMVITLLTISYQAIKAALMNPVKSLRTE